MKKMILLSLLFSLQGHAGEKMDKVKRAINTGAEKVDSGTRTVIKKAKEKIRQEQQERKAKKAKKQKKEKK